MMGSSFPDTYDLSAVGYALPVIVADDDFCDFLEENSFEETIGIAEFWELWNEWAKENIERMTNEELIAKARELCERKIAEWQEVFDEISKYGDAQHQRDEINSWTTHLAEMDEHKLEPTIWTEGVIESWGCFECETYEPCEIAVTKAKRLLGVE